VLFRSLSLGSRKGSHFAETAPLAEASALACVADQIPPGVRAGVDAVGAAGDHRDPCSARCAAISRPRGCRNSWRPARPQWRPSTRTSASSRRRPAAAHHRPEIAEVVHLGQPLRIPRHDQPRANTLRKLPVSLLSAEDSPLLIRQNIALRICCRLPLRWWPCTGLAPPRQRCCLLTKICRSSRPVQCGPIPPRSIRPRTTGGRSPRPALPGSCAEHQHLLSKPPGW
jgi:hypothetical protein